MSLSSRKAKAVFVCLMHGVCFRTMVVVANGWLRLTHSECGYGMRLLVTPAGRQSVKDKGQDKAMS